LENYKKNAKNLKIGKLKKNWKIKKKIGKLKKKLEN